MLLSVDKTDKADDLYLQPEVRALLQQFPQYFGDQPMTNGPVYVGAFVLLLAILALFVVDTPMKWALSPPPCSRFCSHGDIISPL